MCALAPILRGILEGRLNVDDFQITLLDLAYLSPNPNLLGNTLHRQVWRLQDMRDGGGLGFAVEVFFSVLRELLSHSSKESNSALYIGTFRIITSDWGKHKRSLGTQKLLLDMLVSRPGIISNFNYPTYIIDEFLVLLGNILEGQTGPHIDDVVQQLSCGPDSKKKTCRALFVKALGVITRARASAPPP